MRAHRDTNALARHAHAFLFSEGGELTRRKLALLLSCGEVELEQALNELRGQLEGSGQILIETDTAVCLAIEKEASEAVLNAQKKELERDIGEAGLEVLAIVLYLGPSTRARIDYIRGVNTSSTLRTLLARGLLERTENPDDAREYFYRPSIELLAHLGVEDKKHLPDYATIAAELNAFESKEGAFDSSTEDNERADS